MDRMMSPHSLAGLILDMDGVIWRGSELLPGATDLFAEIRASELPVMLVTNNATGTPQAVQAKLHNWGIEVGVDEILTSALATASYMRQVLPEGTSVFVIGEQGLVEAVQQAGFKLSSAADGTQAVAVGMDKRVDWAKLAEATLALRAGAEFFGTNPDPSFPTERGQVPGNGAILAALRTSSDIEPTVIGKPEPHLFLQALDHMGVDAGQALMLGDRLTTDILGAQRAGVRTALLLTGVTSAEQAQASPIQADFTYADLSDFLAAWDRSKK